MKRLIPIVLALGTLTFADAPARASSWVPLGPAPIPNGLTNTVVNPISGRVTAIAIHPTDPAKVYAGTAQGGVYRTLDGGSSWTQLMGGAASYAIGALAFDPSNPTTVFVGTGDGNLYNGSFFGVGIYVIRNAETAPALSGPFNLSPAGADVLSWASISRLLFHPTDSNILFVATAKGGGSTFHTPAAVTPPIGLYRSTNAQSASPRFSKITVNTDEADLRSIADMVMEPGNPNVLICTVHGPNGGGGARSGGIWRTADALAATPTFTRTLALGTNTTFVRVALAASKLGGATTFFAATEESASNCPNVTVEGGQLRKSTDGGLTWSATIPAAGGFCGLGCLYDMAVAVSPLDPGTIYLGGSEPAQCSGILKKSTDGAASFAAADTGLRAATHVIALAPSNPSVIYTGNDGGVFKSTDAGATWTSLSNTTFSATQLLGLALHPIDRTFALAGSNGNGALLLRPDGTWFRADEGSGGTVLVDQNAADTTNVTMYHTYFSRRLFRIGYARVTTTANAVDGGWSRFGCGAGMTASGISCSEDTVTYPPIALGPGNPAPFYIATDRLYRSTDRGATLAVVSQAPLFSGKGISAIGISPQNDNVRIVGVRNGKVYATTTGSSTLTDITSASFPPSDFPPDPSRYITRAVIDPNDANIAYVTFGGYGVPAGQHVWKTTNLAGGAGTWAAAGSGIPDSPVNAFAIDPLDSNALYAGTDSGVYHSSNGGGSWAPFGTGLPPMAIFDMKIQSPHRILRVATNGQGLWEIALGAAPAPPSAPTGLAAAPVSTSQIDLSWTDTASNEDGFRIERKTGAGGTYAEIATVAANATSYQSTGLSGATTYVYRVRAYNGAGPSAYSNEAAASTLTPPPPAAPSNLNATAVSSSQINLTWTDNAGNEDGFRIERKTGAGGTYAEIATVAANATSYQSTGLSSGTTYFYQVRAYNGAGPSGYSNEASATTTTPQPPAAPSNLNATAVSSSQINLTWTDNAGNEDGFRIERKTGAGGTYAEIATVAANATSYQSTGLSSGTTYFYQVRAYNGAGPSGYSNEASATTTTPQPPAAPSNLNATAVSSSQINLTWTDNATDETGFKVERSTDQASWTTSGTAGANATSFPVTGLSASTLYFFRVRATNATGDSANSNTASATTQAAPTLPAAPSGLTATPLSKTQIRLNWTDNATNETGFKVERSTNGTTFTQIATTGANVVTYTSTGLKGNTTYYYRLRATNASGDSAYSNTASATTPRR